MENIKITMRECTKIDKPLVSILLAVYKPNVVWLIEQLDSLNNQTYPNIELVIWDDCPENAVDERYFQDNITKFPYKLIRSEKNLGSNGAFEELTKLASGEYISYCDQDDIWNDDKVEKMVDFLECNSECTLVCSDMLIIDKDSRVTNQSITEIRKRHTFRSGADLTKYLLVSNFVTGCAMMIRTNIALEAIPFIDCLVHDQWLAIIASLYGEIGVIKSPLLMYRQHNDNQTGILTGVVDKQSYYEIRLLGFRKRIEIISKRLVDFNELHFIFDQLSYWINARIKYFNNPTIQDLKIMNQYREYAQKQIYFEIVLPYISCCLFNKLLKFIRC